MLFLDTSQCLFWLHSVCRELHVHAVTPTPSSDQLRNESTISNPFSTMRHLSPCVMFWKLMRKWKQNRATFTSLELYHFSSLTSEINQSDVAPGQWLTWLISALTQINNMYSLPQMYKCKRAYTKPHGSKYYLAASAILALFACVFYTLVGL